MPELTREQMYEDYDAMVITLNEMMPHAIPIRESYNIDVWKTLAEYREKISNVENTQEFAVLVGRALQACKGHHLGLKKIPLSVDENYLQAVYGSFNPQNAAQINSSLVEYAKRKIFQEKPFHQSFYFSYFDGNYYIPYSFDINNQNYPGLLKLVGVDGFTPEDIEFKVKDHAPYFDSTHKRFYRGDFYCFFPPQIRGERMFDFLSPNNDKIKIIVRDADEIKLSNKEKNINKRLPRTVLFLAEYNAIYIRVPSMDYRDQDFYLSEIDRIQKDYQPRYAIIDIRHNGGGADSIALLMVNMLLSKINISTQLAFMATERQRLELIRRGRSLDDFREERIAFLDNQLFLISDNKLSFSSSFNEIPKVEHIYVLSENVYSAAGTLSSRLAADNDNITSVGLNNPMMLGRGVNPFVFALPNSHLTVQVEPALDITGSQRAEDCLHTNVEIELKLTPQEYFDYQRLPVDSTNIRNYFLQKDPFMQKVFEIIKSTK